MSKVIIYYNKARKDVTLRFNHRGTHSSRSLGIRLEPNQWDGSRVINHPNKDNINASIAVTLANAQTELLRFISSRPTRALPATEIRDAVCEVLFNETANMSGFFEVFEDFIASHEKKGTRAVYHTTYAKVRAYDPRVTFETLNKGWIRDFEAYLRGRKYSVNYIGIQLRNIRAVVHYAIDKEVMDRDPFRNYKIEKEEDLSRPITAEQFRLIVSEPHQYADLFALQFYLIGINCVDLYNLTQANIRRGRVEYTREKTGKRYSIGIQPEAATIIARHKSRNKEHLLDFFDGKSLEWFKKDYNAWLYTMERKHAIPEHVTSYTTRYTWSTVAREELGIYIDDVSLALGHSFGLKVTKGYVKQTDKSGQGIVDRHNRAVIDFVLNQSTK